MVILAPRVVLQLPLVPRVRRGRIGVASTAPDTNVASIWGKQEAVSSAVRVATVGKTIIGQAISRCDTGLAAMTVMLCTLQE